MREIITAQEASRILGISGQAVREHIKRKIPPFDQCGFVFKKEGNVKRQYLVYTRLLLSAFQIPENIAKERVKHEGRNDNNIRPVTGISDRQLSGCGDA